MTVLNFEALSYCIRLTFPSTALSRIDRLQNYQLRINIDGDLVSWPANQSAGHIRLGVTSFAHAFRVH